jgi:hypothetical protein
MKLHSILIAFLPRWIFAHFLLMNKARDYFGVSDLEKHSQAGGIFRVVVGDALCSLKDMLVRRIVTCLFFFTSRMQDLLIF